MAFKRILVAVDEEPIAARAAEVGIELATALGAHAAFIYVIDPASVSAPDGGIPASELIARAEQEGKRFLSAVRQRMTTTLLPLEFVTVGAPAAEIIRAATEWPADLIVIASHGRRGVTRALLGSVAEAVMRQAPCPVLVIRAPA